MGVKKEILLVGVTLFLLLAAAWEAAPVLIELNLENREDFEFAKNLEISAWARWGNIFLAEVGERNLSFFQEKGINFEVISRSPRVQKGYLLFLHPGIEPSQVAKIIGRPVLKGSGQFFAQLDPQGVKLMRQNGCAVLEVGEEPIRLTYLEPIQIRKPTEAPGDWIQTLVEQVSADSLQVYAVRLQAFQTRYSYSDSLASARQWIFDKLSLFGIDSLYLEHFFYDSDQWNVVATVPGTVEPDKLIVVGGHYDSVVLDELPGPLTFAPGADDNGSGTAATLEMARIIAKNPLPKTVVFIAFAQEEQGLIGSYDYANKAFSRGDSISFMLNMDMIGYRPNSSVVKIYHDPPSVAIADLMVSLAPIYAGLTGVKGSGIPASDHWPFMQKGYRAVVAHEHLFNPGWHKNSDITDSINFDYHGKVVKLALPTVASLSQTSCQPLAGDPNQDQGVALADIIFLVNSLFNRPGGPWTVDPLCRGDVNGDGSMSLADVIYLVNFLFGKPGDWTPVPTGSCCVI